MLGIGFVFTLDLLITVARNWSGVAKVARDRRAGKVSDHDDNAADESAADEGSSDAPLKRDDHAGPNVEANVSENRLAQTVQAEIKPARNAVPEAPTAEFESRVRELFGESGAGTTDEKPSDGETE